MNNFKLKPADILVNVNDQGGPLSVIKRWAMSSPYDHVFIYMGQVGILVSRRQRRIIRVPMLFESDGDGVVIESLASRYGQKVVVMRLKSEFDRKRIPRVLEEAVMLASDERARYDYSVIATHITPKLILEKLHLPIPLRYHRDELMICSEACAEVVWRAGLVDIVSKGIVPLPSSFVESSLLTKVWEGILSSDSV